MRRWIRLGIVVAAIAAMVVAVVLLQSREEPTEVPQSAYNPDDPDRIRLLENPREELDRIEIVRQDDTLTVYRDAETQAFVPEYPYEVDWTESRVNRIVSGAASLTSRRVIGETEDTAQFGFDNPTATVTVKRSNGDQQVITVGGMTPAQDGYYVMRPDDPVVYLVYQTWITPFLSTLDSMREKGMPAIAFETIERIQVDTLDGVPIVAEKLPEWDKDPELGYSIFVVTKPYARRYQLDTSWIEELGTAYPEVAMVRFADDGPTNLAQYGLNPPRARLVLADATTELDLLIGDPTQGGRYARFADGGSVFVVSNIDPMVDVDPQDTISRFALIVGIDLLDRFVVEGPDATYTGVVERTEVEGEEDPLEEYFLNDVQIEEDLFKDLYQWAIGLLMDAPRTTGPIGDQVAKITYYLNDGSQPLEVVFAEENTNFLSVVRGKTSEFLISKAKVLRMLRAFADARAEL